VLSFDQAFLSADPLEPRKPNEALGAEAPPKRRRGRPPKQANATPCPDTFAEAAARVARIPDKLWPAAKEGVELRAAADRRLPLSARSVLTALLAGINRRDGDARHSVDAIAARTGLPKRSVIRGLKELTRYGYALREIERVGGTKGVSRRGRTTLPALYAAAEEERARRASKAARVVTNNSNGASQGGDKQLPDGGDKQLHSPHTPLYSSNPENLNPARAPEPMPTATGLVFSTQDEGQKPPRVDRDKPMNERLSIPGRHDQDPERRALREAMATATRGWNLDEAFSLYLRWVAGNPTRIPDDAVHGFLSWARKFHSRRGAAPGHYESRGYVG